jgi:archaellin
MISGDESRQRGQIGAGTIVILIAVLIVAATTAGVLFNVTGVLQSQAGAAGETVSSEVESPIQIVALTGRVDGTADPPAVNRTRAVVALDGAQAANLDEATVHLETSAGFFDLVYSPDGAVEGESYGIDPVSDPDGSAPLLSESDDRFAVVVETPPLSPNDRVSVEITLETGATETIEGRIPDGIESESAVTLR